MYDALAGIRVLELAHYAFVPSAGGVLSDWGADVVKVGHPAHGDPMWRAGIGRLGSLPSGVSIHWETLNRGKRSVGVDVATPDGRVVLEKLVRQSDVFLTSFLPAVRQRLRVDVDDIRALNPSIVYARGTAHGPKGPERDVGGYDINSYWARSGMAHVVSQVMHSAPDMPLPGMGDIPSGFALAAGVTAALLKRERTGVAPVVDVSLLASGIWTNGPYVGMSYDADLDSTEPPFRNALARAYETQDGRYLYFAALRLDLYWEEFCERIGRPDLATDERFRGTNRADNADVLVPILEAFFRCEPFAHWARILKDMELPWAVVQSPHEVHADPQVVANGYVTPEVVTTNGESLHMPATPVQFDEVPLVVRAAPEPAQHTEEVLLELGYSWDDIVAFKDGNAVS